MSAFQKLSWRMLILMLAAGAGLAWSGEVRACPALSALANTSRDASAALLNCIKAGPAGGRIELAPGTYVLKQQISINTPVVIATAGVRDQEPGCAALRARCARILIDVPAALHPRTMPVQVNAAHVSLIHLVIEGSPDPSLIPDCANRDQRARAGGIRVFGSDFMLRKSVLRNFACHSALQARQGARGLVIENNLVGPNGDHRTEGRWSDGITIHDSENAVVRHNSFIDNTDVQLIFGGCRNCRIDGNQFRHSGSPNGASFAELMFHTFPGMSGNFSGTVATGNDIDCGAARRCGYGIMVGANPWRATRNSSYPGGMSGGSITGNVIRNAAIGIDVDAPTGPVFISANDVQSSGGSGPSDCGTRSWPAVNVAPSAAAYVKGNVANQRQGHQNTLGCLINRHPR